MSSDDNNSVPGSNSRARRTSFSSTTFNSLLGRSNTTGVSPFPGPITSAAAQDQRRRMSSSASGTSPTQHSPFARRVSVSTTNSDTIPESAIDDEEGPPGNNPFARRMSKAAEDVFNGTNALRKIGTPGTNGEGFNWSEQIRSRAESSVSSAGRPSFSNPSPTADKSPPPPAAIHERAKSISTVSKPPVPQTLKERIYSKPDDIGERMLKGDYYY